MNEKHRQQTVDLAIDSTDGSKVHAKGLLDLNEATFTAWRREAFNARNARRKGIEGSRFTCAICGTPLYLSRYQGEENRNRWFKHDGAAPECPWYEHRRLSPEQWKALQYHGEQEGARHRAMKMFIAQWLAKEPDAQEILTEKVTFGLVLKGEWKRPDVRCCLGEKRLVFEIQLSYTFVTECMRRDDFYRAEQTHILWIFREFNLNKSAPTDEAFFNRRNLFVLDEAAYRETRRRGRLTLSCWFQRPRSTSQGISEHWESRFVTLDDLKYPTTNYRPFHFDFDAEKRQLEHQRDKDDTVQGLWLVDRYLEAVITHLDADKSTETRKKVDALGAEISRHRDYYPDYDPISTNDCRWLDQVLSVLLSFKLDRVIGYRVASVFQVLEACVRQRSDERQFGLAIFYMKAFKHYNPTIATKYRPWIRQKAQEIMASLYRGEQTYRRDQRYEGAITWLLPELYAVMDSKVGLEDEW